MEKARFLFQQHVLLGKIGSQQYSIFICAANISKLHTVFWDSACLSSLIHKPLLHWFPNSLSSTHFLLLRVHLGFALTRIHMCHMQALGFPPSLISSLHSHPLLKAMTERAHYRLLHISPPLYKSESILNLFISESSNNTNAAL